MSLKLSCRQVLMIRIYCKIMTIIYNETLLKKRVMVISETFYIPFDRQSEFFLKSVQVKNEFSFKCLKLNFYNLLNKLQKNGHFMLDLVFFTKYDKMMKSLENFSVSQTASHQQLDENENYDTAQKMENALDEVGGHGKFQLRTNFAMGAPCMSLYCLWVGLKYFQTKLSK